MAVIPDFDGLPPVKGRQQGNTWGFWGDDDEIGSGQNHSGPRIKQKLLIH
jgi:hypothetical protein